MNDADRDLMSRLQLSMQRIEQLMGNRLVPDGYGVLIDEPKSGDPNFDSKDEWIRLADATREDVLRAIENPMEVALKDTQFDESIFGAIQMTLSNDGQRQAYIELASAMANARKALLDVYRSSLTRNGGLT
jgi:hypothetical protein